MLRVSLPRPFLLSDMEDFAATVRQAVVETFVSLDNDWISVGHMAGGPGAGVALVWEADPSPLQRACARGRGGGA